MRVPLSWLREFVDVPTTGDPLEDAAHVHAALVRVGLEEEDVHGVSLTGPIVVGEVLPSSSKEAAVGTAKRRSAGARCGHRANAARKRRKPEG